MNKTHKLYKNISEASLYLSLPLSLITIISGLLFTNDLYIRNSWLVNKTLDTPTFIVLISYLTTTLRLKSLSKEKSTNKITDYLILTFLFIIIIFLITFDTLIPNQIPQ